MQRGGRGAHTHLTPGPACRQDVSLSKASHLSGVNFRMSLRRRLLKPPNTYMVLDNMEVKREKLTAVFMERALLQVNGI